MIVMNRMTRKEAQAISALCLSFRATGAGERQASTDRVVTFMARILERNLFDLHVHRGPTRAEKTMLMAIADCHVNRLPIGSPEECQLSAACDVGNSTRLDFHLLDPQNTLCAPPA